MIGHFRTILPPVWGVCAFVVFYIICLGLDMFLRSLGAAPHAELRLMVLVMGAGLYGIYRVVSSHPAWRSSYFEWLSTTPWTHGEPLPFGPVHITWQDAVVIGILIVLGIGTENWPVCPLFFLLAYLVTLSISLAGTKAHRYAIGVLFCLVFLPRGDTLGPIVLVALPVAWGLAYAGLKRSLAEFPWDKIDEATGEAIPFRPVSFDAATLEVRSQLERKYTGWPFDSLKVCGKMTSFTRLDRVLVSLLVGWSAYNFFATVLSSEGDPSYPAIMIVLLLVGSVIRFLLYRHGHAPPISILGRLFNRRWIIPGYDRVYVAPLISLIGGIGLLVLLDRLTMPEIAAGVSATFAMLVLTNVGPSIRDWHLTGQHTITPLRVARTVFLKV